MSYIIDNLTYILCVVIVAKMYIGLEVVKSKKRHVLALILGLAFIVSSLFYDANKYIIFFIALNVIVKVLFVVSIKTMLIYSIVFINLHTIVFIGATYFMGATNRVLNLHADKWIESICNIGILLFVFIFGLLARKFTLLGTGKIRRGRLVFIFLTVVIDSFILTAIGERIMSVEDDQHVFTTALLYILVAVEIIIQLVSIVYLATARDTFKEREELVEKYLQEQEKHYEDLSIKEYETKKFRHDILNHLNLMAQLCEDKDIEVVEKYLAEINVHIQSVGSRINTHNDIADAIFNRYYQSCQEAGMTLDVQGHFPSECNISAFDICTILSNLLDNAMRAESEINGELISVEIRYSDDDKIFISVENDYLNKPKQQNGRFLTSKKNKGDHGFGLENIKDCVEKNHGFTNITTDNNKFRVWICLDNSKFEDSSSR